MNDRFAATPNAGAHRIAGGDEWLVAVAGDAAHRPCATAARGGGPGHHVRWIVHWHAHDPSIICSAITGNAAKRHVKVRSHYRKRTALPLSQRIENGG